VKRQPGHLRRELELDDGPTSLRANTRDPRRRFV